jgi:mono/diheme cytochrome c family protein
MPRVFTGPKDQVDQRAADLAAYLVSMGAKKEEEVSEDDVPLGGALFANLGCISCHTQPTYSGGDDEFARVPLSHLKAKWQAPALREYLKDPLQNYKWSRMPNFRLTDDEAKQLAAFLLSGEQREFAAGPAGDAARGAQLLVASNCLNCHAGLPAMTTPKLADTLKSGWERGCMAPDDASRGSAPDFMLTAVQRESLLAFAAAGFDSLKQDTPVEFAHRQMTNLRCASCHQSDGKASVWSSLEGEMIPLQSGAPVPEEEGVAHASTAIPMLTWLGEKHGDSGLLGAATRIEEAVAAALAANGKYLTPDLGGSARISQIVDGLTVRLN